MKIPDAVAVRIMVAYADVPADVRFAATEL